MSKVTQDNQLDYIIRYENGELDEEETIELFAFLISTGLAWQLQGQYGRMAQRLLEEGIIKR